MTKNASGGALGAAVCAMLSVAVAFLPVGPARAASNFPDIPVWAIAGAWRDSSLINRNRCVGSFKGPLAESILTIPRAISVRFLRDRRAEVRADFGGYRIYRMTSVLDTSQAVLIRRFSLNPGNEATWSYSRVTRASTVSILAGNGDGSFGAKVDVSSGVTPVALGIADLNRDTLPDLVVANAFSNTITQYAGLAGGGILRTRDLETGANPAALALADMNGDTTVDVVVVNRGANSLTMFLNRKGIGLVADSTYATGLQPTAAAIADVNRDGSPDVVVTNDSSSTVSVFLGTGIGTGRLGPKTDFPAGSNPHSIAILDLSADGIPDLVVGNRGGNTVSVFLGAGGAFPVRTDLPTGTTPFAVAVGDVSGDGFPDIVVANEGDATVSVLLGDGVGGFSGKTDFATGIQPHGVAIGDVSADGKPDIVVANEGSSTVSVLLGNGLGGFGAKTDFATGVGPGSVVIGDLTGDGKPDLAVTNHSFRLPYVCKFGVVNDSILTFVDPDSNGQYRKVCRRPGTVGGRCETPGDSIFILVPPPGPHDGFLTWYSITIERKNTTDPDYEDLFVPDTLNNFARCTNPLDLNTCPNLNNKRHNVALAVEPTSGPTANPERVLAVPNPYRGSEVWDPPGRGEVHFINLPSRSRIRIYTVAGDLVRELQHSDTVRDFERWDLKNGAGQAVASGIYVYRVESGTFHFQDRLVVIR